MSGNENPVKKSAKYAVENATYIRIKGKEIDKFSEELSGKELALPKWEAHTLHTPVSECTKKEHEENMQFSLVVGSINFQYTDYNTGKVWYLESEEGPVWEAFGMAEAMGDAVKEKKIPLLDSKYLSGIKDEEVKGIFEKGNFEMPMLKEKAENLRALGKDLQKYGGRFKNIIDNSGRKLYNNGKGIVDVLSGFESFKDEYYYRGRWVQINKRSQLVPGLLFGIYQDNKDVFDIKEPEEFTIYADYILPKAARERGLIGLHSELKKRIDSGALIKKGTYMEIELRLGTVYAYNEAVKRANVTRKKKGLEPITGMHVDAHEWLNFGIKSLSELKKDGYGGYPHHRTITKAY